MRTRISRHPCLAFTVGLFLTICASGRTDDILQKQLDRAVDIDRAFKGTADEVLAKLAERFKVKITVDKDAFKSEKTNYNPDVTVLVPRLSGIRLRTILELALAPADAVYEIRDEQIVIVPNVKGGKPRPFPPPLVKLEAQAKEQQQKLGRSIELKEIDASLKDVLAFISDRFDFNILIDETAFQKERRGQDVGKRRVKLGAGMQSPGGMLIQSAAQAGVMVSFRDDHIRIVPVPKKK